MKKSLIFLLFIVVAGTATYFFTKSESWNQMSFGTASSSSILDAIPSNSTFFIDVVDPASLDSALVSKKYGELIKDYSFFDDLLDLNKSLVPFLNQVNPSSTQNYPLRASMHLAQRGQMKGILYYKIDNATKQFKGLINELRETSNLNSWNYNNEQLYDVILLEQNKKIAFAYVHDILIISEVSFLVEDAVNELLGGGSLMDVSGMRDLMSTSDGRADIHLYFNYEQSDLWLSCFLNNKHLELLKPMKKMASWSLLDIFLNKEEIYINGSTAISKGDGLADLAQSSNSDMSRFIPSNVVFVKQYNYAKLSDDYFIAPIRGPQVHVALMESLDENYQEELLLFFELSHPNATLTTLQSQPEYNFVDSVRWNGSTIVHGSCAIDSKFKAEFPNVNWLSTSFLVYENLAVFGANDDVISGLKSKWIQNNVLSEDEGFTGLFGEVGMTGALDIYIRPDFAQELIKAVFDNKMLANSANIYNDLKHLSLNRISFNKDQNVFRTEGSIVAKEVARSKGSGLWNTQLESGFVGEINSFYDKDTKQYLLFGQDASNVLYCYDATGKKLWTKELDGQIIGELNEADYYRNNKSQLLFNTQNTIYWLSKTGEDVADYPIKLSAPATAGLALFDYDKDKKYRIFVPTNNGNVYGYEASGKPLTGWNPKVEVGVISRTMKHFSHMGKDYILAANGSGNVLLWNRKGEWRIPPVDLSSMNDDYFLDKTTDPYKLKSVNTSGKIIAVDLKGRITSYQLPVPFKVTYSKYVNLSSELKDEIIVSDGLVIKCFSHVGKELFIYNLPEKTASNLSVVQLDKSYFGIMAYNELSNQCYLIDGKGNIMPGFPLSSEVQPQVIDLFGSGDLHIVIQNENKELEVVRLP